MRKLLWGGVALLVLVAALAGAAYWQIDRIARAATERGTAYALGVGSEVEEADVGLFTGRIELKGLKLQNPPDFDTPFFITNDSLTVQTEPTSYFSETIRVPRLELTGLTIHIEQRDGTSNLQVILDHLRKLGEGEEEGPVESPDTKSRLQVDRVIVRDIVAHVQTLPAGGELSTVTVEVPRLEFEDVTSGKGKAVAVAELTRRLTPAIVLGVLSKGGELPADLVKRLGADVARVAQQLGPDGLRLLEQVGGPLVEGVLTAVEKTMKTGGDIGELLGETLDNTLGDALQKLFKKQPDKPAKP